MTASVSQLHSRTLDAAGAGMPTVAVRVLGPLAIEGTEAPMRRASTAELVAYLALRAEGATRDQLLEAMWPGVDPVLSRQRLWQSASEARLALGGAMRRERERYRLDRGRAWVDVDEFIALLSRARRGEDEASAGELLESALVLVRDEPLAGADYLWADAELRMLRASIVELAEAVAGLRLARGDAFGSLVACERALALEPMNERLTRLAMEAEFRLGLRGAVVRRYQDLDGALTEGFGLEPERETKALFRRLLGQM